MGCIYCGFNARRRTNGSLKIGEVHTANTPANRFNQLRKTEPSWEPCGVYLKLPNASQAECWVVESVVRVMLEKTYSELTNVGNDHFNFPIKEDKEKQIMEYFSSIFLFAIKACKDYNIPYEVIRKDYKRKY